MAGSANSSGSNLVAARIVKPRAFTLLFSYGLQRFRPVGHGNTKRKYFCASAGLYAFV
jgi:hypothetical protein